MECSTTELRQHCPGYENRPKGPSRRADPCHKAPVCASAGSSGKTSKTARSACRGASLGRINSGRDPVPGSFSGLIGTMSCDPASLPALPPLHLFRHVLRSSVYSFGDVVLRSGVNGFAMTDDGDKREVQIGAIANKSG